MLANKHGRNDRKIPFCKTQRNVWNCPNHQWVHRGIEYQQSAKYLRLLGNCKVNYLFHLQWRDLMVSTLIKVSDSASLTDTITITFHVACCNTRYITLLMKYPCQRMLNLGLIKTCDLISTLQEIQEIEEQIKRYHKEMFRQIQTESLNETICPVCWKSQCHWEKKELTGLF